MASNSPVEVLTREEVQRLLDQPSRDDVVGLRDSAALATLYYAAATAGEVCELELRDLRRDAGEIRVRREEEHPRRVPLDEDLAALLERYLEESRRPILAQAGVDAGEAPALFVTNRGARLQVRDVRQLLGAHAKAAGLGGSVKTNTLRLSRAWHLREAGVSPEEIQRLLGSSSRSGRRII